jgi:hypothetical protein
MNRRVAMNTMMSKPIRNAKAGLISSESADGRYINITESLNTLQKNVMIWETSGR